MIIKTFITTFLLFSTLIAQDFKVASYNVENIFDLNYDKTEYKEYIPNNKSHWNEKTYKIKLENISKTIKDLNADIISLQEIESKKALADLLYYLPQYKYYSFTKNSKSAVGVATLSKFEIIKNDEINIESNNKFTRPIQITTIKIENKLLHIFNNHWPSKRSAEASRVEYALSLQKFLKNINKNTDYILLGDFNSNYNEFETFKFDNKLNNTYGVTGINQVLNTTLDEKYITKNNILSKNKQAIVHYNLWLEKDYQKRFSYKYKGQNNTPDNMILSSGLFDDKNISYINESFGVFKPKYLYDNGKINRWEYKTKHLGIGYSDHLPIFASFSTSKKFEQSNIKNDSGLISSLYEIEDLSKNLLLKDVIVIYKSQNNAIIKQENNRAIYIYKEANNLKLGYSYDILINKVKNYNGLKEITKIEHIKQNQKYENYKSLYMDTNKIDIFDLKYQNEVISNLQGVFKKGYLHFNHNNENRKIKLYAKDISLLPKNGQKINIISAHLGFYKSKVQIVIHNKSDISVN